jgi:hypothetical protein
LRQSTSGTLAVAVVGWVAKYSTFFLLGPIGNDYSIYSYGLFTDPTIQQHPGNKGMRLIADSIWAHVLLLK